MKITRLTERDLNKIVKESVNRIIKEAEDGGWVVDSSEAQEAYELAESLLGYSNMEEISRAMVGTYMWEGNEDVMKEAFKILSFNSVE